jgi:hypothetical protein
LRYYNEPAQLKPGIVSTIVLFTLNSSIIIAAFAGRGG